MSDVAATRVPGAGWLRAGLHWLDRSLELAAIAALAGCVTVMAVSVVFRYLLNDSLAWAEEVARFCLVTLCFIGGALAYRADEHVCLPFLLQRLPPHPRAVASAAIAFLIAALAGLFCWTELALYMPVSLAMTLPGTGLPQAVFGLPATAGMAAIAVYAVRAGTRWGAAVALPAVGGAALLAAVVGVAGWWLAQSMDWAPLVFAWAAAFLLLAAGMPIAFALGLGGATYLLLTPEDGLFILPQQAQAGVDSFVLLSVPLFVLAAKIQEESAISDRLLGLVRVFIGRLRGGSGLVTIGGTYLFSGISGSPTADISAIGAVMMPAMQRDGFSDGEAVAIISASAVMGHTIPPSIAIIVLATVANLSVGALFVAGILPAAALALVLAVLVTVSARRQGLHRAESLSWRDRRRILADGAPAMVVPGLLFGGLLSGIVTPTEVAALAVLASLAIAVGLYRLPLARLPAIAGQAARLAGMATLLLATANVMTFASVDQQLPNAIAAWLEGLAASPWEFLVISFVLLVAMGALLEFPALLIFGPLLMPVATALGFNPVHYAIFLIDALVIGHFLPPLGVLFTVACGVTGTSVGHAIKPVFLYLGVVAAGLLAIGAWPDLTLALPRAAGLIR